MTIAMRIVFFLLLLASFALSSCQSRGRQPPKNTVLSVKRVELPATFIHEQPFVDLQINGKGPYRFLLDTGIEGSLFLSAHAAREVGISFSRQRPVGMVGTSGRAEYFALGIADHVGCPQFSLTGVEACPMSSALEDSFAKLGVDDFGGMIGILAFKDVLLEIDYPRRKISVARLGGDVPALESGIHYGGISPRVTIETPSVKYATTTAMVDTGASAGILLKDIASYPTRVGLSKRDGYSLCLGGWVRPLNGQLAGDIHLGSIIWRDPLIEDSAVENLIGNFALASCKLIIDQQRKMLWLESAEKITTMTWSGPLEPDGRPAVYGLAYLPDGDAFVVKEVDPGGRAERAGVKVGDLFSWERADASTPADKPGTAPLRIRLHVVRGSENLEIILSLTDPLPDSHKAVLVTPTVNPESM